MVTAGLARVALGSYQLARLSETDGSNRRFQFQKRSQLLLRVHNKTLSVAPMRQPS
jgi:hypothetical protein